MWVITRWVPLHEAYIIWGIYAPETSLDRTALHSSQTCSELFAEWVTLVWSIDVLGISCYNKSPGTKTVLKCSTSMLR